MKNHCRTPNCQRCGAGIPGGGKRRWCDPCETPKERARRLGRLAARRRREATPESSCAGRLLTCGCGKCGLTFTTKPGRQRVFAEGCPNRWADRDLMRRGKEPVPASGVFDRTRRIPESPCQCGTGCGLTFRKVIGQRGRKYHPSCPGAAEIRRKAARDYEQRKALERKAKEPRRSPNKPPATATHRKQKICRTCFNLPHARDPRGCPGCLLPFAS